MFVLGLTLVVLNLMHRIPSAYIVAQTVCYLNEEMQKSELYSYHASMLMLAAVLMREGSPCSNMM